MTDIIVRPQIIRRIIRLKVQGYHIIDTVTVEGGLVAIDIVRILIAYGFHVVIKRRGMQDIVMIIESDKIPCSHFEAFVCITGYAFVLFKLFIPDAAVLCCSFPAVFTHICMCVIGSVGKAQFPFLICLRYDRIYSILKEILRSIIQRYQYGEGHVLIKLTRSLCRCLFRIRKTGCTVLRPGFFLDTLAL